MRPVRWIPLLLIGTSVPVWAASGPPPTPKRPVTTEYHGVSVSEDYRWLEDGTSPEVQAWTEAENKYARSVLDHLPDVGAIRKEIARIRNIRYAENYWMKVAGGKLFCYRDEPPKQQPFLVAMDSEDDPGSARVVADPNAIDPSGKTSIDWYEPSPDGRLVAVCLSVGGTEKGDVHVFETDSGREVAEVVPRVNGGTAAGSLAWDREGTGFFYSRYPHEGERPKPDLDFYTQVYHHRLGTSPDDDRYEIGKEFPRIAEIQLKRSLDGAWCLANVANGDGGEYVQYLRSSDGTWTQLTHYDDLVVNAVFGPGNRLFLLSRKDAPKGKIVELTLDQNGRPTLATARTVVSEGEGVIKFDPTSEVDGFVAGDARLFVIGSNGGPEEVRVYDFGGQELGLLPIGPLHAVREVTPLRGRGQDAVLYRVRSYIEPNTWYRRTEAPDAGERTVAVPLSKPFPIDFGDAEIVRDWAVSKDGTRVPMSIVRRKGTKLVGGNPVLLTGYGGYGLSMAPYFDPLLRLWLDRGGVFAYANIRGGGEFGQAWHHAGNLTNKQNVFDDFIACAGRLIEAGYTTKDRLAIEGGSNGGLLMGAVLTQRPDLFRAVVSHAGVYDMLRVEDTPNGAFNIPEYGTVKDPKQFRALRAYSPYHNVADGVSYPAVLLLADANDPRVDAWHSRKMAARLQATGAKTVLLRSSASVGHGLATALEARIEIDVDVYAFLFDQLRMRPKGRAAASRP